MHTLNFLKKLCLVGRTLLEQSEVHENTLAQRKFLFDEHGSFQTKEEQLYQDHVRHCVSCRKVLEQER